MVTNGDQRAFFLVRQLLGGSRPSALSVADRFEDNGCVPRWGFCETTQRGIGAVVNNSGANAQKSFAIDRAYRAVIRWPQDHDRAVAHAGLRIGRRDSEEGVVG